ncbi:MAG TPA: nitroreductase family protein [Xanthobacteraceae bacterium]|nr:nitroreductase family protein [Xanthobacteraceae bacterium]
MQENPAAALLRALSTRFGEDFDIPLGTVPLDDLACIASHATHRLYSDRPLDPALLRLICACALSAPSKSDLQQCDLLIVRDPELRKKIATLIPDQAHIAKAPAFLVVLANGRRLKQIAQLRGKPFVNDHLDQFFNAAVDAGIVLGNFLRAAAAAGLGCCPISVIRDHAGVVSDLLKLPERVIPVAGLCVGWPAEQGHVTARLPLDVTLHTDRFDDSNVAEEIDGYDRRRDKLFPYRTQRDPTRFGKAEFYGWSEDKARQYGVPQRADFGSFVRAKGFNLE